MYSDNNISFKPSSNTAVNTGFQRENTYNPGDMWRNKMMTQFSQPKWQNWLLQGVELASNKDKIGNYIDEIKEDPTSLLKSIAAYSLKPYLKNKMNFDLKNKSFQFNPTDRLSMGIGKDEFEINWEF